MEKRRRDKKLCVQLVMESSPHESVNGDNSSYNYTVPVYYLVLEIASALLLGDKPNS